MHYSLLSCKFFTVQTEISINVFDIPNINTEDRSKILNNILNIKFEHQNTQLCFKFKHSITHLEKIGE